MREKMGCDTSMLRVAVLVVLLQVLKSIIVLFTYAVLFT